jgi:predicted kinase
MPNIANLIQKIHESKRTLLILCGFPYAGKSYIAKEIQKSAGVVYLATDDIFHRHGFDWNTNTLPISHEWQQIFDESYEISKSVLQEGKNVLYDSTNQTLSSRDKLREVARSIGAKTIVIYIQCSPETVWKRWEKSALEKSRPSVSKNLVQMTIDQFETPTVAENVITIIND